MSENTSPSQRAVVVTVLVAALGYFVDIYDLLLFAIVRVKSLTDLGVSPSASLDMGLELMSVQMFGLLVGGLAWGVLGDKKGRLSVLFGSILLYSIANIANAFVHSVEAYRWLRFVAGIGLAGELGAAVTLVSEILPARTRGYGTAIVAGVGLLGAVFAALIGRYMPWRHAYILGGVMGFALLALRIRMFESGMYDKSQQHNVARGDVTMLLMPARRFFKYLRCVLIGIPVWYVVGILVASSPEFARLFQSPDAARITSGDAVLYTYVGLALGDITSGSMSQWLGSRKRVVAAFLLMTAVSAGLFLSQSAPTSSGFYTLCGAMGFGIGYWAVFVTIAAEQFGTNLRATVATSVPNFVRGSVPVLAWSFKWLRSPTGGALTMPHSAAVLGVLCAVIAGTSLWFMEETHGKDLDYLE
jgi:MFS transporter, putative metabolite:H+ symporter